MSKLRTTLIAALIPAIAGFSLLLPSAGNSPTQPGCPALVAHALTSPALVRGSFACLSSDLQFQAAVGGYDADAGLQQLAKDRGYSSARYLGTSSRGAAVYEFSGSHSVVVLLWTDSHGKVMRIDQDAGP